MVAINVGISAYLKRLPASIPCLKYGFKIDWPIGLGEFAIIVKPPPVIAPETTEYFSVSEKLDRKSVVLGNSVVDGGGRIN